MKFKGPEKKTDGKHYLRLKDGDQIIGVFRGQPYEFYEIFNQGEVPKSTQGATYRFRVNFITKEGSNYVAKIFQNGTRILGKMQRVNQVYNGLENVAVILSRTGSTKDDTMYDVIALPDKQQPTEEGWKLINQVPLHDVTNGHEKSSISEPSFDQTPMPDEHDEIPF